MDDVGINALLDLYPLAEGANIFVSDGKISIPYEDGEPENASQKTVRIKTEINTLNRQIEVIEQSNKELGVIRADLDDKFDTALADFKSAPNNKSFEANKKELENAIDYNNKSVRNNIAEVERMQLRIKLLTEGLV